jgi:hypothetical protein
VGDGRQNWVKPAFPFYLVGELSNKPHKQIVFICVWHVTCVLDGMNIVCTRYHHFPKAHEQWFGVVTDHSVILLFLFYLL